MLTIEKVATETVAPAVPLSIAEQNSLLAIAVGAERTPRVPGAAGTQRDPRAWRASGQVD